MEPVIFLSRNTKTCISFFLYCIHFQVWETTAPLSVISPLEFVWCNESVQALLDFQMAVQISDDLSSRGFMEKEKKTETGLIFGEKIQIAQKIWKKKLMRITSHHKKKKEYFWIVGIWSLACSFYTDPAHFWSKLGRMWYTNYIELTPAGKIIRNGLVVIAGGVTINILKPALRVNCTADVNTSYCLKRDKKLTSDVDASRKKKMQII